MIDLLVKEGQTDDGPFTVAVVRGSTFDAKARIKEAGFRWGFPYDLYAAAPEGARSQDALEARYGRKRKCWSLHRHGTAGENAAWIDGLRAKLGLAPPEETEAGEDLPF